MLDFVLNFLFPPSCIICGKHDIHYICKKCEKRFEKYRKYNEIDNIKLLKNKLNNIKAQNFNENKVYFNKIKNTRFFINLQIQDIKQSQYYVIDNQKFYWDKLLYAFEYKGIVRKYVLEYKFGSKPYISNFFAYELLKSKKVYEILKFCDIIIPVPLDKKKQRQRGYNQSELIAKILAEKSRISFQNVLLKIKHTKTQSLLENSERKKNVENAFCIKNPELVKNKKVIIFDDIYTTGATANEISKVLKSAGAKSIFILVIAKD